MTYMEEVMEIESTMDEKTKKPTDINAPKRPLSAFFLWANKMRPSIVKKKPEWSAIEVGKELGKLWKHLPEDVIAWHQAKYEKNKEAYHEKLEKYKKSENYRKFMTEVLAWKIHCTKKPFMADPYAPKEPPSAYTLYAATVKNKVIMNNPDMIAAEVAMEQRVHWEALIDAKRKPWIKKAEDLRAKYEQKLERYHKTRDYQSYAQYRDAYKEQMIAMRHKLMGTNPKKKRPRSTAHDKETNVKSKKAKSARKQKSPTKHTKHASPSKRKSPAKGASLSKHNKSPAKRASPSPPPVPAGPGVKSPPRPADSCTKKPRSPKPRSQLEIKEAEIKKKDQEIDNLHEEIERLKAEIEKLKAEMYSKEQRYQKEIGNLKKENENLKKENENQRSRSPSASCSHSASTASKRSSSRSSSSSSRASSHRQSSVETSETSSCSSRRKSKKRRATKRRRASRRRTPARRRVAATASSSEVDSVAESSEM